MESSIEADKEGDSLFHSKNTSQMHTVADLVIDIKQNNL